MDDKVSLGRKKSRVTEEQSTCVRKRVVLEPFDWSERTVMITDASDKGQAFWLMQIDDDQQMHIIIHWLMRIDNDHLMHTIMLKSRAWKKGQHSWSTIRKECTALAEVLKDTEHFVRFCEFTFLTDHRPLLWLLQPVQIDPVMWALRRCGPLYFAVSNALETHLGIGKLDC